MHFRHKQHPRQGQARASSRSACGRKDRTIDRGTEVQKTDTQTQTAPMHSDAQQTQPPLHTGSEWRKLLRRGSKRAQNALSALAIQYFRLAAGISCQKCAECVNFAHIRVKCPGRRLLGKATSGCLPAMRLPAIWTKERGACCLSTPPPSGWIGAFA